MSECLIRVARKEDLSVLTELHYNNFHSNELSIILGKKFIKRFYEECLNDRNVVINVVECDAKVVAYAVMFFKYGEFEKRFKYKSAFAVIGLVLRFEFQLIKKIIKILKSKNIKNIIPDPVYDFHAGATLLDKDSRDNPVAIRYYLKLLEENFQTLDNNGKSGFWGSTRESNKGPMHFSKKWGLKPVLGKAYPENIVYLIKYSKSQ